LFQSLLVSNSTTCAATTRKKLRNVVFSKDFEGALFKKLGVTRKIKRREIRIFSDKSGQSNGRLGCTHSRVLNLNPKP
jgi:hypothetical protein